MLINKKMADAINKQINRELYSGYLYLSMASYFESNSLKGFAHWMKIQAKEEFGHAMKFSNYVIERGGRVILADIEAPPAEWKSPLAVYNETYEHEKKVTEMINNLVKQAKADNDYASENMLQWFVKEQIEEEASPLEIIDKLKLIGDTGAALLMLDAELGKREG